MSGKDNDLKDKKCTKSVSGSVWYPSTCNKPAKGYLENGKPACGIHMRGEKTRLENEAKWKKEISKQTEFTFQAREQLQAMGMKNFRVNGSTKEITISISDLLCFLKTYGIDEDEVL